MSRTAHPSPSGPATPPGPPNMTADSDDGSRAQQAVQVALDRRDNGADGPLPASHN